MTYKKRNSSSFDGYNSEESEFDKNEQKKKIEPGTETSLSARPHKLVSQLGTIFADISVITL